MSFKLSASTNVPHVFLNFTYDRDILNSIREFAQFVKRQLVQIKIPQIVV